MSDESPEKPQAYAVLPAGKIIGGRYRIESVIGRKWVPALWSK